jgi:Tol biopolymer transport system component
MSSQYARLVEETILVETVSATSYTDAIDLNGADKFSVEVTATVGDSIASLEGSNSIEPPDDDTVWTEIDSFSIAEGESDMFNQPNVAYRWARVAIENDDIVDVDASCEVLVIGPAI